MLCCVRFSPRDFIGCMKLFGSPDILVTQGNNAESLNFYRTHIGTCYIESMIQNCFNFDMELTFDSGDTTAFTFLSVIHRA